MFHPLTTAVSAAAAALAACSPALDWREVRVEPTGLSAMMPCKPQRESRRIDMAGRTVELRALACRAGSSTFAILFADVGGPAGAGEALLQWKTASLAGMRGDSTRETRFLPPGALDLSDSVQVTASGKRPDGSHVESQAAYFARKRHVFQAVIYTSRLEPAMIEPFFTALRFE